MSCIAVTYDVGIAFEDETEERYLVSFSFAMEDRTWGRAVNQAMVFAAQDPGKVPSHITSVTIAEDNR